MENAPPNRLWLAQWMPARSGPIGVLRAKSSPTPQLAGRMKDWKVSPDVRVLLWTEAA